MDFQQKILDSWCCELPEDKKEIDEALCEAAKVYLSVIFSLVPECPERTLAIRRLQEHRLWIRQAFCCETCE